jgi:ribosomal protein S27AE
LADGVEDGKITRMIQQCPRCQRVMSPRHKRCLYCGYAELQQSAFEKL